MKKKIHVVPHSHWDREWYFTTSRSKVYLMKDLKDVLDTLDDDKEFKHYMLDAQGSLLDDYIKWMPQDKERIERLVKEGKLMIGPWYTQSDLMLISAESIVRNMYYGMKRCESFGKYMNVAYVPDSFGQSGNMPQIYRQFGIEDTLFWRGVSDEMVQYTDFNWRGDDGSLVFAKQIPNGYYVGGNIPEKAEDSAIFWEEACLKKEGKRAATKHIYFPNGFDQAPIRKNLPQLIKERNQVDTENEYVISSVEQYISDVKAQNPQLEEISGELLNAKHMRIHKSIFSSRSDLKTMNTKIQNYLVNVMEPLLSISHRLGNDYPHEAIKEVWQLMFENAAHDSIGSCISDAANEDVAFRYKQANDIAVNLVELHSRLIATNINSNKEVTFTVFNTLPYVRSKCVKFKTYLPDGQFAIVDEQGNKVKYTILSKRDLSEYVLSQTIKLDPSKQFYIPKKVYEAEVVIDAETLPALGYRQYAIHFDGQSECEVQKQNTMENEFYKISINQDGSLNIIDKKNHFEYKKQAVLVENGDDGDSFNYSPPREDLEVYSTDSVFAYEIQGSSLYQMATIAFDMLIPEDLEARKNKKCTTHLPVKLMVGLAKGSKVIDFKVQVDNRGLSHRLCVLFDSELVTKFNYADEQFGLIKRPNVYEKEMASYNKALNNKDGAKFEGAAGVANWSQDATRWQEPPIAIEPTQSYVALADDNINRGIALFPQGVREYEIIGEQGNQIRLTLFRTYGFMGKADLLYRPGRASGERIIETKDAQLLKEMEFSFGFMTFTSSLNDANVDILAREYATKDEVYTYAEYLNGRLIFSQMEITNPKLKPIYSMFTSENNLVVSAIKKCEEEEGYIIRLFNGKDHKSLSDKLHFNFDIEEAYYVNLKEEKQDKIEVKNNAIQIKELSHCQFVSVYVK
ncbi:MAG: alpha-mannosidase [Erysipelotrichia bacterium]|nr:alpha-mannosidase [Erysipelotrichia bacterium]